MYTIKRRELFSPTTFLWEVLAPEVAEAAQPGQFVMVRLKEGGERIPLTIADFSRSTGVVTLVVKVVGKTTEEMATYPEGASFQDLIGPLGSPTHIEKKGHVVLVGGGLGVAPVFPILRGFKQAGSKTTAIIGFRNSKEIFWKEKFEEWSDRLILMTEDGSSGSKGTTIDGLREILYGSQMGAIGGERDLPQLKRASGFASASESIDEVLTIGPIGMMQATAEATRSLKIPTFASMNSIMVDGIGMCGSCRVTVGGEVLFACVDGPDMDAHQVDFEELKVRQIRFRPEEERVLQKYHEECALKKRGQIS